MEHNNPQNRKSRTNTVIGILIMAIIGIIAVAVIAVVITKPSRGDNTDYAKTNKDAQAVADKPNEEDIDDYEESNEENNLNTDEAASKLRHAPNMYVEWVSTSDYEGAYDTFIIDWKCTETADGTYWAVHEWDEGYAGFQDRGDMCDVVLLSLWNLPDGTQPQVEYYSDDYDYGDFSHEGSGAYVFTPYDWEVDVWYSMKIEITYEENKTIFTQYVCKEGEDWLKTAALSYPTIVECTHPTHVFQEDYDFNDLSRSCMLRNAAGRFSETGEWDYWNEYIVSSSYYPDDENPTEGVWDVNFGCDYKTSDTTVEIFSGGRGNKPNGKEMPYEGNFQ